MNLHYPVPDRANRIPLFLMVFLGVMGALFLIVHQITPKFQPFSVTSGSPVEVKPGISVNQPILQIIPVPEPLHTQPSPAPLKRETPVPNNARLQPVLQPVATPPFGR